jgi:hypothetical protein
VEVKIMTDEPVGERRDTARFTADDWKRSADAFDELADPEVMDAAWR